MMITKRWTVICAALFLLILVSHVPSALAEATVGNLPPGLPRRPPDTPDVVILGIAGFFTGLGPVSTSGLYSANGTQLVMDAFIDMGYSVQWRDYAPSMGRHHVSPFFLTIEDGFEQAVRDIEWIKAHWQDGVSNPTRLVLISASGGGGACTCFPSCFRKYSSTT